MVAFRQEQANVGHSHIVNEVAGEPSIEVVCRKLDDYFPETEPVRLVKIDVEGHEVPALRGMQKILARWAPLVVFEQHPEAFRDGQSEVIELLRGQGYTEFFSIDRVPSLQRGRRAGKVWFFVCSLVMGLRLTVTRRETVEPAFYEMLIARKPAPPPRIA